MIKHELAGDDRDAFKWLEAHGVTPAKLNGHSNREPPRPAEGAGKPENIAYDAARDPFKGVIFSKRENKGTQDKPFRIVKTWPYTDEADNELFEVCRKENGEVGANGKAIKTYIQRRKTPEGYEFSIKCIRQVPYRLLELIEALPDAEPYPIDALGKTLSRAARPIAAKVQVPAAMAAQSVLAAASLAACSHADILCRSGKRGH